MTKSKQHLKVGGAVLVMVLIVMVVLIMMLMATLTVVTTANQRIYTKFEENQAYYTARSALDIFTNNLILDGTYDAYSNATTVRQFNETGKTPVNMKQGLALQLDLYKIKSQNTDGVDLKWAENAVKNDNTFVRGSFEEGYYTLDDTAPLDYIEYEINFPAMSDGSNSYGRFVDPDKKDLDNDGITTDQVAKIRVEVLDRKLAMKTEYTDAEIMNATSGTTPSDTDIKAAIAAGSRTKDYMKIKVTSTVQFMGTEGVAVVVYETVKKDAPANEQALTTSGTATGRGGSSPDVKGGFANMCPGITQLVSGDDLSGTVYTIGTFQTATSNNTLAMSKGSSIIAMNGLDIPSGSTTIKADNDNAYMFLAGESTFYGPIGDAAHGITTIAEKLNLASGSATVTYHGNIYTNTLNMMGGGGGSLEFNTAYSTYTHEVVFPDWALTPDGDGYQLSMDCTDAFNELNIVMPLNYVIRNESNTISITSTNINKLSCINRGGGLTFTTNDFAKINFSADPSVGTYTIVDKAGQLKRKYSNLPFQIDGQNSIEIPTPQSFFKDYYIDDSFDPLSGELKLYKVVHNDLTGEDVVTIQPSYYDDAGNYDIYRNYDYNNSVKYMLLSGTHMFEEFLGSEAPTGNMASIIAANKYQTLPNSANPGTPIEIDVSTGDVYYKVSGYYSTPIKVKGDGGKLILLVEENDTVTFDGKGAGFSITTDDITDTTMTIENGTTKAPNVYIYGATDSKLTFDNNCTVAGYIVAPTGDVKIENGLFNDFTYSGDSSATPNVFLVGSILCRYFDAGNHPSIMYLDKDSGGGSSAGGPHLSVSPSMYVRK